MILTDYYLFKEVKIVKSHRYDCVASTGEYEPFEMIANKKNQLFVYCNNVPDTFKAGAQRKATYAITHTTNITSVYIPDLEQQLKGYGDIHNTDDGLLFLFSEDMKEMEVFVARGYKHCIMELSTLFLDGELDDELDALRNRAKPMNATNG
ncbi:MAG: hypothetical protein LUE27_09485 [Clostridia bacterium]|nr:hypothetical protein [Clostridia bacterium]